MKSIDLTIIFDRETDGRWLADVVSMPGVMAYGDTAAEAAGKVAMLAVAVTATLEAMGEDT